MQCYILDSFLYSSILISYTDSTASLNQIDSKQFEKILKYIRSGVESGATLETGGERIGSKGYYIQPTVFSNVKVLHLQLQL